MTQIFVQGSVYVVTAICWNDTDWSPRICLQCLTCDAIPLEDQNKRDVGYSCAVSIVKSLISKAIYGNNDSQFRMNKPLYNV